MSSFIWLRLSYSSAPVIAPVAATVMPVGGPSAGCGQTRASGLASGKVRYD
ncbi:hypothetical protein [Streptomyces sp. V4I2]|uniref:hypothetical protein n=1 Tax=Streptomyces sp. V4I2 TaxID=3042280 RepID=UPI00278AEB71|nr:hypothetical protein [Streptomyces sp. V4I2]MDQ1051095.1 hypothetical protein [Streptomyces sp. V4I2]